MMSWFTRLFKKQTKVDYSSEKPPSYSPSSKASTFKSQLNGDISPELLDSFKTDFLASPQSKLAQTVIANSTMVELLTNRDAIIRNPHVFSDKIELEGNITNQNKSGVCWIFAATNTLRLKLMKKYNLESFEFSQNYLFFYDKLEKANFFLENVIQLSDKDPKSRVIQKLFAGPADDGGQWDQIVNIILKYGIVPQSEFPNTKHSFDSKELNWLVKNKLRGFGIQLRKEMNSKKSLDQVRVIKAQMMNDIYRILVVSLGQPTTNFDWQFRDKNGKYHSYTNLTPASFYTDFVKKTLGCGVEEMISLSHDPRQPLFTKAICQLSGNVYSMQRVTTYNVTIETLKKAAVEIIRMGDPAFFCCDVMQMFAKTPGLLDIHAIDYKSAFDVDVVYNMTKAERLDYGESTMTHAMALTGVHINESGKIERWRVENSWGTSTGAAGFEVMTDEWFDTFVYQVVVEKKMLKSLGLEGLLDESVPVYEMPLWDALV